MTSIARSVFALEFDPTPQGEYVPTFPWVARPWALTTPHAYLGAGSHEDAPTVLVVGPVSACIVLRTPTVPSATHLSADAGSHLAHLRIDDELEVAALWEALYRSTCEGHHCLDEIGT